MIPRLVLFCVGIAVIPSSVFGQELPASKPVTRADVDDIKSSITELTKSVQQMSEDTNSRIDRLEEQVRILSDYRGEDRAMLEQIAKTDKDGRSYVRLDTSHAPTRNELRRAVSNSVPSNGTVTIYNGMNKTQLIAINGATYEVMSKTYRDITVPVGDFRVQLPHQPVETRYVGLPRYKANINIRPQSHWVAPISVATYSMPLTYVTW